jgi:transcriptional regulator GlxA family with amidase domain
VEEAAAFAGTSRRHLERLFREWVGVGPKVLARLARFQAAAALLLRAPQLPLAAVSADSGYFDQSHMVRDFLALGGTSPERMRQGLSHMTAAMMSGLDG